MDGTELILTTSVTSPDQLVTTGSGGIASAKSAGAKKTEKMAKDFESVFVTKLLDEMKETIGQWGFEEEAGASQVKGLFWLYLARDVADKGGLGLWKDLNRFFTDVQNKDTQAKSLDEKL